MQAREQAKVKLRGLGLLGLSPDALAVTPTGASPGLSPAGAAADLEVSRAARTPQSALEVQSMQT